MRDKRHGNHGSGRDRRNDRSSHHGNPGGRGGTRDGRDGRGRAGRGRGGGRRDNKPDLSAMNSVLTNLLPVEISDNLTFAIYTISCRDKHDNRIESRSRRSQLFNMGWESLLKGHKQKDSLRRTCFFSQQLFFSGKEIPGLEKEQLPKTLVDGATTEGDTLTVVRMNTYTAPLCLCKPSEFRPKAEKGEVLCDTFRCGKCIKSFKSEECMLRHCAATGHWPVIPPEETTIPATKDLFLSYLNTALQAALGERLKRWGSGYINAERVHQPRELDLEIYEAIEATFSLRRRTGNVAGQPTAQLLLSVDLRAKVLRTTSLLDVLHRRANVDRPWSSPDIDWAKRLFLGTRVLYVNDKRTFDIVGLDFSHSPKSLMVASKGISHEEYFASKGINLKYPSCKPMVVVIGRNNKEIFYPAELLSQLELDPRSKQMLPIVASFRPQSQNEAIAEIQQYLTPGSQHGSSILPSLGVFLGANRLVLPSRLLSIPNLMSAGVKIGGRFAENWANSLSKAKFNISRHDATTMKVILFHDKNISGADAQKVFQKLVKRVNNYESKIRFGDKLLALINTKDYQSHCGIVEKVLNGVGATENLFMLDFVKTKSKADKAYPIVKHALTRRGYISQFLNWSTTNYASDDIKTQVLLDCVAQQILHKLGVKLWHVELPPSLPLPVLFIGADVYHSPPIYDLDQGKRVRKPSCAAIVIELIRNHSGGGPNDKLEVYSETRKQGGGQEFQLEDAYQSAIQNALKTFRVTPASCIVFRDGIGNSTFSTFAQAEIRGIRAGLRGPVLGNKKASVPLCYMTCQKRIDTKFLSHGVPGHDDGSLSAPAGTMVSGIQGMEHQTFYINGRAPPFSTAKPVRFVILERDSALHNTPMSEIVFGQCCAFCNWSGPIKVPAQCQMAHTLAELAGTMPDSGESIAHQKFNTPYFL